MSGKSQNVNDTEGELVGYARVSTSEQRLSLQLDALERAGVDAKNIFIDKVSGAAKKRPGFRRMMLYVKEGDTVVVWRLDRFARSIMELLKRMEELQKRGVRFHSLTEAIDTKTASGRLVFHVLASIADFEREITRERVSAGIKAAKKRGRAVGAKPKLFGKAAEYAQKRRKDGATAKQIVEELKQKFRVRISERLVYHRTKR
jgi:DNA invertase Pin-like site-specific DNA recombinase